MNPLTLEWVNKAEGDLVTAQRELRARKQPNFDAACFHAQQTAEKYFKAYLQDKHILIPRTHNLVELANLCMVADPTFALLEQDSKGLDGYAVRVRYPGQSASKDDAKTALKIANAIRSFCRSRLGF